MKIDTIQISNFRGIESLQLELDPRFTLLVGDNGSGKTSILSAISVALGIWHVGGIVSGPKQWRNITDQEVREVLGKDENGQRQFVAPGPVEITATGSIGARNSRVWTRRKKSTPKSKTVDQGEGEIASDILAAIEARDQNLEALPLLAYYGAGRAWLPSNERQQADLSGDLKNRQKDGYYDCLNERIRMKDLLKWFVLQAAQRDESGLFKPAFNAVRQALSRGIPGIDEIFWDHTKGEVVVIIQGKAQPFTNLSDGQRTMAATLADMAIRAVALNAHLLGNRNNSFSAGTLLDETPGVVLIDEVDVHLHPEWQRSVVADLLSAFPKVQFICSSHSPQVVGETLPGSLRIYQPATQAWDIPNQSFGMDSNWILKVHMGGKDMDDGVKRDILAAEKHAVRREFPEAEVLIRSLRERVGNSEEIQFAASTLERLKFIDK